MSSPRLTAACRARGLACRPLRALAFVVSLAVAAVLSASSAADVAPPEASSNWAGYAVNAAAGAEPIAFADVTGTWVQPRVACTAGSPAAAAFWVGLGGFDDDAQALEQLGTEESCGADGTVTYSAWWEVVPAPAVTIRLKVSPGDRVTAAVVVQGQRLTMSLKDLTRRTRFSKTQVLTQRLDVASAEWIAEAPASCRSSGRCGVLPLAGFGSVAFANAAAVGDGHPGTILDPLWQATPVALSPRSGFSFGPFGRPAATGSPGAAPSEPTPDGRDFSVAVQSR